MALTFTIQQICDGAENGDKVSFEGQISRVWEVKERTGTKGDWTSQGILIESNGARIAYQWSITSDNPALPKQAEGRKVRVSNGTYAPYETAEKEKRDQVRGGTLSFLDGDRPAAPQDQPAAQEPSGDGNGTKRQSVIPPRYEEIVFGADRMARAVLGLQEKGRVPEEFSQALCAMIATAVIQASRQFGSLNMSTLIGIGQAEVAGRKKADKERQDEKKEEPPPSRPPEITATDLKRLDDYRKNLKLREEEIFAFIETQWGITIKSSDGLAVLTSLQFNKVMEWLEKRDADKGGMPF